MFKKLFKCFWPSESRLRAMYRLGVQAGRAQLECELKLVERPVPSQLPTNVHPLERSPHTEPLRLNLSRSGSRLHMFNAQKRTTIHLQHKGFQLPPARPGKPIELYATGLMPIPDVSGPDDAA